MCFEISNYFENIVGYLVRRKLIWFLCLFDNAWRQVWRPFEKKMFIQCAMETEKICLEIAVLNIISTLLTLIKLSKITYFMPQIRKSVEYQRKINQKRNIIHCTVLTSIFVERYRQYNIFPWHNTVQKVIFMRLFFFQLCFANAQHHYYIKYKTASILIERDQCCWSVAYKMYASVRLPYNNSGPFERKWNKKMHASEILCRII